MRILYYSEGYTSHDYRFISAFSQVGWRVSFLTRADSSEFSEKRAFPDGVTWQYIGKDAKQSVKFLRNSEESFDLRLAGPLHSCSWELSQADLHPWAAASWAYDLLDLAPRFPDLQKRMVASLDTADLLFCDSPTVQKAAEAISDWSKRPILQIPWGVDLQRMQKIVGQDIRAKYGWGNYKIWISTRNWAPIYDTITTVQGFHHALLADSSIRLVLAGGGSDAVSIHHYIAKNSLEQYIIRPGLMDNDQLLAWVKVADFYVSSSRCDGSSVSMLEAMGYGLPVLVTDIASNNDWIKPGVNGLQFKVGDPVSLAEGINAISRWDATQIKRVASANQALISTRADWTVNHLKLTKTLETLAGC